MSDRREQILARIFTILSGIRGVNLVVRNVDEIPEQARPCLVLIDGDETRSLTSRGLGMQPVIVDMVPVIAIGVSAKSEDIGGDANSLRAKILPALLGDAQLDTLATPNGRLQYNGANGKLSQGRLMACDIQLLFSLSYPLDPADLP
jgi:hypothetical protein